jgi:hypothetical protein
VLTPLGVNVRSGPDVNAARLSTVSQGVRLDISESRKAGADNWLHVKSQNGQVEGWVIDRPDLLIRREVSQHVEQGGVYSNLFPSEWQLSSGNPATMTAPQGEDRDAVLTIALSPDIPQLPATPTQPGQELRQEGPLDIYGKSAFVTIYKLNGGGYEFAIKTKCKAAAYLVDYRQSDRNQADTTLFKSLLSSVIAPDCAPGA